MRKGGLVRVACEEVIRKFKIRYIVISTLCAIGIGFYIVWRNFTYSDQAAIQASRLNPLDGKEIYRIIRIEISENDDAFVYGIIRMDEPESSAQLAWREIGLSSVELGSFVDKPVYLNGQYVEGKPIVYGKVQTQLPAIYLQEQIVITIEKVTIANR